MLAPSYKFLYVLIYHSQLMTAQVLIFLDNFMMR